jgi:hypothetical protein
LTSVTYAVEPLDRAQVVGDLQAFMRRLRAGAFGGEPFPYVWVPERGKEHGRLHAHVALPKFVSKASMARLWGRGFVDLREIKSRGNEVVAASVAAGYMAKYVGESFEDVEAGRHRYEVGQGFLPICESVSGLATEVEAIEWAHKLMDGQVLEQVWSSEMVEGWHAPPARLLAPK